MLAFRAENTPDKVAYTFDGEPHTFAALWQRVNLFAAYLLDIGVSHGDRVLLALPNGDEFFDAFYGVQRAGAIAVPVFPGSGPERVLAIATKYGAQIAVLPSTLPAAQLAALRELAARKGVTLLTPQDSAEHSTSASFPIISPDDIAFIQNTSGSTGNPKGVQLSHHNLLTNVKQMIEGWRITEDEIFVSWLPVYHDMGLIIMTMIPFYLAAIVHLLPTSLIDLRRWLDTIQRHKATFAGAPDFAYRLCLRYVKNPAEYDLSSLRIALNGSEPVRHQTMLNFEKAFGLKDVMVAAYGLAEATVGVCLWPPGTASKVDDKGIVSVGSPFPDVEIEIVENDTMLKHGGTGEIVIKSTARMAGYYDNPSANEALLWRSEYIRSGDVGYLDEEGNLYIVGRKKNIIKRSGETLYPQEIEEIVDDHATVRFSAALGIDTGRAEGEQLYVFAEVRGGKGKSEDDLFEIARDITASIHAKMGFRPARVYLLKPHAIPLTHNGKMQHLRLKERYEDGSLMSDGSILFPDY